MFFVSLDQLANNKFEQKKWEDLLLKMLARSLEIISDEQDICEFGNAFGKHITSLYANLSDEKASLKFSHLVLISKSINSKFI